MKTLARHPARLLLSFSTACAATPAPPEPPSQSPEASAAGGLPARWRPNTIGSFAIFHFEGLNDFAAKLPRVDVVTLELDDVERAGGEAVTDLARARGARVICYNSTGFESWRSDADSYPAEAKGGCICKDRACTSCWPGELWGDVRQPSLLAFLSRRADRAARSSCDGIEFDNMDHAFNQTGLNLTRTENINAARQLAQLAHERGLAAVAKNAGEIASDIAGDFDGVFVEECARYRECQSYAPYRGKLVAMVEYGTPCTELDWAACNVQDDYFDPTPR